MKHQKPHVPFGGGLLFGVALWLGTFVLGLVHAEQARASDDAEAQALMVQCRKGSTDLKAKLSSIVAEGFYGTLIATPSKDPYHIGDLPVSTQPEKFDCPNPFLLTKIGREIKIDYSIVKPEFIRRILVLGGKEQFVLKAARAGDAPYLDSLGLNASARTFIANFDENVVSRPATVGKEDVQDLLNPNLATITKVEKIADGNCRFSFVKKVTTDKKPYRLVGDFIVAPALSWAVCSYQFDRTDLNSDVAILTEYGQVTYERDGASPRPVSLYRRIKTEQNVNQLSLYRPNRWEPKTISPEEFTLDHYEVQFAKRDSPDIRNVTLFWGAGAAIVAVALGFLLRHGVRRRSQTVG